jgi:hypothetical protein
MKLTLLLLPILGFSLMPLPLHRAKADGLKIGESLPKADIRLKDVSNKDISLQEVKESGGLLVIFSCNTCPYVIRNQSRTKEICGYARTKKIGVAVLNANEGDRQGGNSFGEMQSYAREQGYQWFYAVDRNSELANAFGASRTPECYLFDRNSKLVYHGAIDDSPGDAGQVRRAHLHVAMDEMLAGKEVTVKETRSVGCSINRG